MPKCIELLPCDWLISNLCYQAIIQVYLIKFPATVCVYIYIYIYIYINAVKVSVFPKCCIFCLTRGPTRSWRNGYAQCCQLSNIADPFSNFFPLKKAPKPCLDSENRQYCHACVRSCCPSVHTPLSLCASARFSTQELRCRTLSQTRYYVASLILHASIAEITAQLLPLLCVFDFIRRRPNVTNKPGIICHDFYNLVSNLFFISKS